MLPGSETFTPRTDEAARQSRLAGWNALLAATG